MELKWRNLFATKYRSEARDFLSGARVSLVSFSVNETISSYTYLQFFETTTALLLQTLRLFFDLNHSISPIAMEKLILSPIIEVSGSEDVVVTISARTLPSKSVGLKSNPIFCTTVLTK